MSGTRQQQQSADGSPADPTYFSDAEEPVDNVTYMTCLWSSSQLGVAYLDQNTGHVRLLCKPLHGAGDALNHSVYAD